MKSRVSDGNVWLGDDELTLYDNSYDTKQGPPFTSTPKRLGLPYNTSVFQHPSPVSCVLIVYFITLPLQLWLRSLRRMCLRVMHYRFFTSQWFIAPERLQHLVVSDQIQLTSLGTFLVARAGPWPSKFAHRLPFLSPSLIKLGLYSSLMFKNIRVSFTARRELRGAV